MLKWIVQEKSLSSCWSGTLWHLFPFLCLFSSFDSFDVVLLVWHAWWTEYLHFICVSLQQVVIMLVIDKENDCALLSRQSRFVPRMWSCLAGFMEVCGALSSLERKLNCQSGNLELLFTCLDSLVWTRNNTKIYSMHSLCFLILYSAEALFFLHLLIAIFILSLLARRKLRRGSEKRNKGGNWYWSRWSSLS